MITAPAASILTVRPRETSYPMMRRRRRPLEQAERGGGDQYQRREGANGARIRKIVMAAS